MISTKPIAVVAMFALAGAVVAQGLVDERRVGIPTQNIDGERKARTFKAGRYHYLVASSRVAGELLDAMALSSPSWTGLQESVAQDRKLVEEAEQDYSMALEAARDSDTKRLWVVHRKALAESIRLIKARSLLRRTWDRLQRAVSRELKNHHREGTDPPTPLVKLLLLGDSDGLQAFAEDLVLHAQSVSDLAVGHFYLLHHSRTESRILAAQALGQLRGLATDIVPHFLEMLEREDPRLVQEVVTALGMIGPAANDAIPTLEKLTEHEDRQTAERARASLRQIRGG